MRNSDIEDFINRISVSEKKQSEYLEKAIKKLESELNEKEHFTINSTDPIMMLMKLYKFWN